MYGSKRFEQPQPPTPEAGVPTTEFVDSIPGSRSLGSLVVDSITRGSLEVDSIIRSTTPGKWLDKGLDHIDKAVWTLGALGKSLAHEFPEQVSSQETGIEKIMTATSGATLASTALVGQALDRLHLLPAVYIPLAVRVDQNANLDNMNTPINAVDSFLQGGRLDSHAIAALFLGGAIYVSQGVIAGTWGKFMKRYKDTSTTFDDAYPVYKETLAEKNAGYWPTLMRQSVGGLGSGNTMFVSAEVLEEGPEKISDKRIAQVSHKTALRMATAATSLALPVLYLADKFSDKYVGFWSMPDVVSRLEKGSTWIVLGFGAEPLVKGISKGVKKIKNILKKPNEGDSDIMSDKVDN